jgi:hypothetical protein
MEINCYVCNKATAFKGDKVPEDHVAICPDCMEAIELFRLWRELRGQPISFGQAVNAIKFIITVRVTLG